MANAGPMNRKGEKGEPGKDGKPGKPGKEGPPGRNGMDGSGGGGDGALGVLFQVASGKTETLETGRQMTVHDQFLIDGCLELDGQLIMES